MTKIQRKTVAIIILGVSTIVALFGYISFSAPQLDRQLVEISKQNPLIKSFIEKYPRAEYSIAEGQLTRAVGVHECWIITWRTSARLEDCYLVPAITHLIEDVQIIEVWISKVELEIVEIKQG